METIICRPQNKSRNSEPMTAYFRQNVCCRKYKTPNRQMNHVNNNGSQKTMDPVEKYSLAFSLFDSRLLRKIFMRRKYFTQEYLVKKMAYVSTFPAMVIVHISTSLSLHSLWYSRLSPILLTNLPQTTATTTC